MFPLAAHAAACTRSASRSAEQNAVVVVDEAHAAALADAHVWSAQVDVEQARELRDGSCDGCNSDAARAQVLERRVAPVHPRHPHAELARAKGFLVRHRSGAGSYSRVQFS